jgi:SAM-dependent methyltransferase
MATQEISLSPAPALYSQAVRSLLAEFAWNSWFTDSYWPENEPRIRLMARIAREQLPSPAGLRALEVGCGVGYVAYLFKLLGFDVSAVDAYDDERRDELFQKGGIPYQLTNLNDVSPLGEFPKESFDLVLLGEVFEHILNQPAGLLREIHRLLRPDGLLILTTPNPSTLANALRVLGDRYLLWGTPEFLRETKLNGDRVIDRGDIHYREYPAWVVRGLLAEIGYQVGAVRYVRTGIALKQPPMKRWLKWLLYLGGLSEVRVFAPGYVVWARKTLPAAGPTP